MNYVRELFIEYVSVKEKNYVFGIPYVLKKDAHLVNKINHNVNICNANKKVC